MKWKVDNHGILYVQVSESTPTKALSFEVDNDICGAYYWNQLEDDDGSLVYDAPDVPVWSDGPVPRAVIYSGGGLTIADALKSIGPRFTVPNGCKLAKHISGGWIATRKYKDGSFPQDYGRYGGIALALREDGWEVLDNSEAEKIGSPPVDFSDNMVKDHMNMLPEYIIDKIR